MIKVIAFLWALSLAISGCAIGLCKTWEVGDGYLGGDVYGMFICKGLIENYNRNNKQTIFDTARQLLASTGEKYGGCSVIEDSLIIYSRTDQVFLKIDCTRLLR